MIKVKLIILSVLASMGLIACGGGGGNSSTGGTYFTHEELAREFVYRINIDLGYDVELVKSNTLQYDYIVVYDYDYGTYDAYYIGNYNPGENLYNYVNSYEYNFYYDLIPEIGNTYYDPITGTRFQKIKADGKNLTTMKALVQDVAVQKATVNIQAQYGLSEEKAADVARFAYKMQSSPEGTYQAKDFDKFAKELTGSTITDFQNDIQEGNSASLARRIQQAAETTGMGPEAMNALIEDVFMQ